MVLYWGHKCVPNYLQLILDDKQEYYLIFNVRHVSKCKQIFYAYAAKFSLHLHVL